MILQVKERKSSVGTGAMMSGRSLDKFTISSVPRRRVFQFLYNQVLIL